jgi:uncharacterized protein YndB with AHSA1/START domain
MATTCPCRACATVQELGLKFVVHHGEFTRYEVAGRVQLHGNDVNLIHRLLKNTVPIREYLLATASALSAWPDSFRGEFVAAPQRYDLGEVDASYLDLRPVRAETWNEPRARVDPEKAKLRGTVRYPGTPEQVFHYFTDPKLRQIWMGVLRVDFVGGARGSLVGAEYHCVHGENQKAVFKVLACTAPRELTMQIDFPFVGTVWRTDRLESEGSATTRVDTTATWETKGIRAPFVDFLVSRMLRKYSSLHDKRVTELLREAPSAPADSAAVS